MKTGDTKLRRPVWSESIHAVENVSSPTNGLSLPRYTFKGSTERFYASDLQRVELDTLVTRRRRRSSGHARGFYKRVVIPVPALMERKAGARTARRPVRFQDGASSSSSSSSSDAGRIDDDDSGSGSDSDDGDDDSDEEADDKDGGQLQHTRRGRVIRLPPRFVDQEE